MIGNCFISLSYSSWQLPQAYHQFSATYPFSTVISSYFFEAVSSDDTSVILCTLDMDAKTNMSNILFIIQHLSNIKLSSGGGNTADSQMKIVSGVLDQIKDLFRIDRL
jgi:hypothetical protein